MKASVVILGVPIDDVTMDEAVDEILRFVRVGRDSGRWHQVTTVNLDFVTNAVRDRRLLALLQRAALNIPDGMPLVWASKALRTPLRGRVAGVDLVDALARRTAAGELTMFLFGGAPGVAAEAAERMRTSHPGARVMHGALGAHFDDVTEMDSGVLDEIRDARPDVVCVALGNPKQEWWIERYGPELQVPVLIGVGGTFDFIVGRRRRAPDWMQRVGLEWLARALQEPARLGPRYARDAWVCVPRFAAQWWRQVVRASSRWRAARVERTAPDAVSVNAGPSLDLARDPELARLEPGDLGELHLDLAEVEAADARTVGSVVALVRAAKGGAVRVVGMRPSLRRGLADAGVLPMLEPS